MPDNVIQTIPGRPGAQALARADATVFSEVMRAAERHPDRVAMRFLNEGGQDERCLSFAEVDRAARALAARLQAEQAIGERVLILLAPGIDYVVALLGCLYSGAIAVPCYPPRRRTLDRLAAIVRNCGARFAVADGEDVAQLAGQLHALSGGLSLRWLATSDPSGPTAADWRMPDLDPRATALLQYTSGSTGEPKGVCLTQANFLANVGAAVDRAGHQPDDPVVSWLPPFHDMGLVSGILMPLMTGCEAILMSPSAFLQRPLRWLEALSRFGGVVSGGPNFAYELCVRRITEGEQIARLDLSRWRVAFCGAERIQPATMERFARTFAPAGFDARALIGCYGLAESTVLVACGHWQQERLKTLAVDEKSLRAGDVVPASGTAAAPATTLVESGSALPGCELRIVDPDTGHALPAGRVGEIWVRSASVGLGYWAQPELSRQVFRAELRREDGAVDGSFLRTGDLGFLRDGDLYVTGRIKDLIILRGVNHYPDDFETTMRAAQTSLATEASVAFAVDEDGEERLILVQEVPRHSALSLNETEELIRAAIVQDHEIAAGAVLLVAPGALPRTSSGKVQRQSARTAYLEGRLTALRPRRSQEAPSAKAETDAQRIAKVAELMAVLLGIRAVRPDEDFFWLGGHSLLATQLVSRLRAEFSVDLPLRAIFEAPTPRRLAAAIDGISSRYSVPAIPPRAPDARLQLSFSQERMWMLHQLDPESSAYNVAGAMFVDGPLNAQALQLALGELVRRHEVLSCTFPAVDGLPSVAVAQRVEIGLPLTDLAGSPDADDRAIAEASAFAQRPFDIASEPLIRMQLWRLGAGRHLVAASLHHLVTDGWSMSILVSELLQLHDDFAAGRPARRAGPGVSYLDYAAWQREYLTDGHLKDQIAYWTAQLAGATPIELPTDRPRSSQRSSRGDFVPLLIPEELQHALAMLGAAHGTTLFMVLLAAFEVVLHRHTGSTDLVVGIPCANRNHLASEELIGSLVNTLALRLRFDPDQPFLDLLGEVRGVALDAYAHQDLPFERLVSLLPVERRAGESPVISVMFDFQNAQVSGLEGSRLQVRPAEISRAAAQFDLSLLVFDTEIGRTARIEYRADLFDRTSIERLLGHYLGVLQQVVRDPAQSPARIPLFAPGEREALLAACGPRDEDLPPARTVPQAVAAVARAGGSRMALKDDARMMSYQELERASDRLAHQLRRLGAGPGERVAVILERECGLVVTLLAVLKSGAAYVPLDPSYPADRIGYVLEDCRPCVVVTREAWVSQLPAALQSRCHCLDSDELRPDDDAPFDAVGGPVAYVLYTSGSTGRPKGVAVGTAALSNFLRSMAHTPGIDPSDRVLAITTIAFDIAGLELWLPLTQGAAVRLASTAAAAAPLALIALMADFQPTLMQATPATWRMLLSAHWAGQPGLRMLCGGEALPADLVPPLLQRGASLWNMYGPTETTIWSTVHRVTAADGIKIPIGRPIDATRLYVLDRVGQLQPRGLPGEIHIAGAGVAEGYFGREDLTAERFMPDPFAASPGARMYRTGDGGRLRADGSFECMPRLDDQIKIRGFRIEPGEIEAVLKEHPALLDAVVVAPEIAPGDRRLAAYFVVVPACSADLAELPEILLGHLQKRLPAYMIPQVLVALPELPKTPNGKIDRKALPAPNFALSPGTEASLAPRDPIEAGLAALWQELLAVQPIGVRDNFFRLGGHSLLAMQMFARVQKIYGVVLPPALLFQHPTVEHLAEQIRLRLDPAPAPAAGTAPDPRPRASTVPGVAAWLAGTSFEYLLPIQPQGRRPPLFCIHGAGGNVFNFAELAEELGTGQPFLAFQARGVDGVTAPHADIPAMAEAYLAELRSAQPEGPYHLAGYCGGGLIAFEMACRLRADGAEVALLALIDCYRPGVVPAGRQRPESSRRPFMLRVRFALRRHWTEGQANLGIWLSHRLGRPVPFRYRDHWLTRSFLAAARHYRPGIYPERMVLLRAADIAPELRDVGDDLGWRDRLSGAIVTVPIPGNHHTLLARPNLLGLAAVLRDRLGHEAWASAPMRAG